MHEARRIRPVLIVLLVVAIALITFDFRASGSSPAHAAGGAVFGPVENLAGDVASPFVSFYHAVAGNEGGEITALQKQNDLLRAELSAQQVSKQQAGQLGQVSSVGGAGGYKIVPASVVAAGGEYSDTVTINAGSSSGIAADETVLNGDGLVGVVTQVTGDTATVQLASDAASTVGVRMAGTQEIGAISGTGQTMVGKPEMKLTLFNAQATLSPGQDIVTFGSVGGRPYVPGVPVGQVQTVTSQPGSLTQTALIKPFVDFTGIGVVGVVIAPPKHNPGDALLRTTPGATVSGSKTTSGSKTSGSKGTRK